MKFIWAPWRIQYIRSEKPEGCIFCTKPAEKKDKDNYILYRGKKNFVMMNCYPYNPGHLMVAPYRHTGEPEELTAAERNEHFELIVRCLHVLREAFNPGGFNFGANIGRVAGAGIEDHFHSHIVPRWNGDTNFITVLPDIRVIPEALSGTYDILRDKF